MTIEWSLAAVQDVIAAAVPDREMLVWKDVRRTYGEVAERSKGLAGFLVGRSWACAAIARASSAGSAGRCRSPW